MEKDKLLQFLKNPSSLGEDSLYELGDMVSDYPYFQTGQLLLFLNLKALSDKEAEKRLNNFVVYAGNSRIFYNHFKNTRTLQPSGNDDIASPEEKPVPGKKGSLQEIISSALDQQINTAGIEKELEVEPLIEIIRPVETSIESFLETKPLNEVEEDKIRLDTTTEAFELETHATNDSNHEIEKEEEIRRSAPPHGKESNIEDSKDKAAEEHTFTGWLKEIENEKRNDDSASETDSSSRMDLIETFLKNDPRIKPRPVSGEGQEDISEHSIKENESFITDTLAKIYISQELYDKAIAAYQKLSLKYPEKSVYFASQVKKIKELIKKQ
ncbi:MAG: hypothetical protein ACLFUC_02945 [Bacteroidales bacterium]